MQDFSFSTHPSLYRHLKLVVSNDEAQIILNVDPAQSLRGDTPLKLNSYDLGVDIELHDAIMRLRFEHPEVGCVVVTSAKDRCFSAGANIGMLAQATHPWKANF